MVAPAILITWICIFSGPELLKDRIFPFDSALFAANGALFSALILDITNFAYAPIDWLWDYYNQYPALFVRRHPPFYGFIEGIIYVILGVSVFSAKLTVLLFSLLFAIATYYSVLKFWKDELLAFCAALVLITAPLISMYFRSVWIDIPALAFAMLAFLFYGRRQDQPVKTARSLVPVLIFSLLSLYTYQLTLFLLAGLGMHLLVTERKRLFKDKYHVFSILAFVILLVPLAFQTISFAGDSLQALSGRMPDEWDQFAPLKEKLDLAYWFYYLKVLFVQLPVMLFGLALWLVLLFRRKPSSPEIIFVICFVLSYIVFSWFPGLETLAI